LVAAAVVLLTEATELLAVQVVVVRLAPAVQQQVAQQLQVKVLRVEQTAIFLFLLVILAVVAVAQEPLVKTQLVIHKQVQAAQD
jgi:hypothetical protein